MKSTIENTKTVTLVLNDDEAKWLRCVMQNPLYCDDPAEEDVQDKKMRSVFWKALGGE